METIQKKSFESDGMGEKAGRVARQIGEQMQSAEGALHQEPLQGAWEAMERVPVGAYYVAMLGSIGAALGLYLSGKKESAQFVGQWAPTIALLGLMNRLLRPTRG
jgi:phosphotransferase system  glucose/maltose/N-acetylglucosamine-specific IIC component